VKKEIPPKYVKLKAEYDKQHGAYEKSLDQYWNSISEARNASPRRFVSVYAFEDGGWGTRDTWGTAHCALAKFQ